MPALETLAMHLVTEVPVTKLQEALGQRLEDLPITGGALCGGGCRPEGGGVVNGILCGFGCRPQVLAPSVVDPEGALGLAAKDLANVRNDLPKLREAVVYQIETYLGALKR